LSSHQFRRIETRKKPKEEAEEFSFTGNIKLGKEPFAMVFDSASRNLKPL